MIQVLTIISQSWPIAFMVLGAIAGSIVFYLIRWFKQSDRENKAYRANQAVVIHRDNAG